MSSSPALGDRSLPSQPFATPLAPVAHQGQDEPIDLASLLRRCLEDVQFCGIVLHKFAARSADQVAALERALESGNTVELAREAHTLQGVAANLSATALRLRADELEHAARIGELKAARKLLDAARDEVFRCRHVIPQLLLRLAQ